MNNGKKYILVLGAYGLAGRAIVERLAAQMSYSIVAAGRNPEKLNRVTDNLGSDKVETLVLDATDASGLKAACANAAFVINAVGPFSRTRIIGTVTYIYPFSSFFFSLF